MDDTAGLLKGSGWSLSIGTATRQTGSPSPDFYAIYNGEALGNRTRGVVAAMASSAHAWEAAQIAMNGFAEGYYGAGETVSSWRAAARALTSINAWLYGQSRGCAPGREFVASFSAILFGGRRIDVVHVGHCHVFYLRDGHLVPLVNDRLRTGTETKLPLLGSDEAVRIDHVDVEVQAGDRFVLVSAAAAERLNGADALAALSSGANSEDSARLLEQTLPASVRTAAIVVIDVVEPPGLSYDEVAARFAALPIRRPPRQDDIVDGFRIGKTINRGRYTLLKRARDETTNRDVVLKFPLLSMLADQVFRAGFLREAWVGTTIRADCVARYIDVPPERQSCLYLVMPFYRGETLEVRIAHSPRVSLAEGIGITLKLCTGVAELAKHDVVHRDIKPENVMLVNDGNVLLLDLGLAYLTGVDDPDEDRLGGTTRYMAPELFSGTPPNARTEVFALGVTTYRLFARGKFPFGQGEKTPLSRMRPDLPAWLGHCLKRAIATNPAERFADAEAFAAALQNGLVRGDMKPSGLGFRINPLHVWQVAAVFFALSTLYLLLH